MQGTEWYASYTNQYVYRGAGLPDEVVPFTNQPSHDALNIYGDEVSLAALGTNLNEVGLSLEAQGLIPAGSSALLPAVDVSRTGYREQDVTDYDAGN